MLKPQRLPSEGVGVKHAQLPGHLVQAVLVGLPCSRPFVGQDHVHRVLFSRFQLNNFKTQLLSHLTLFITYSRMTDYNAKGIIE